MSSRNPGLVGRSPDDRSSGAISLITFRETRNRAVNREYNRHASRRLAKWSSSIARSFMITGENLRARVRRNDGRKKRRKKKKKKRVCKERAGEREVHNDARALRVGTGRGERRRGGGGEGEGKENVQWHLRYGRRRGIAEATTSRGGVGRAGPHLGGQFDLSLATLRVGAPSNKKATLDE